MRDAMRLRAPQAGVVQQRAVHAKGAVLGPAEQIMLIVPEADALVVEVRADPPSATAASAASPPTSSRISVRVSPIFSCASACLWTSLPA
jgi:multidrug efflux pump subunit AcrA (membrane-fusion protein)